MERLNQEIEIHYFKIKIILFILNLDKIISFIIEKSLIRTGIHHIQLNLSGIYQTWNLLLFHAKIANFT